MSQRYFLSLSLRWGALASSRARTPLLSSSFFLLSFPRPSINLRTNSSLPGPGILHSPLLSRRLTLFPRSTNFIFIVHRRSRPGGITLPPRCRLYLLPRRHGACYVMHAAEASYFVSVHSEAPRPEGLRQGDGGIFASFDGSRLGRGDLQAMCYLRSLFRS